MYYDNMKCSHDLPHRKEQLNIREQEIIALIDEIEDYDTLVNMKLQFPSEVKLDISRFVTGGHSFGAMTSI